MFIESDRTISQTDFQAQMPGATANMVRRCSTLPIGSEPGEQRAARTRKYTEPSRITFKLKCFFSSHEARLALIEQRALARLEKSLGNFIVRCSRRHIEESSPPARGHLLKIVCKDVQPVIAANANIGAALRARTNTYEDEVGGDIIKPAKAILLEVMRPCLANLAEGELSHLYKDLAPSPRVIMRDLISHLRDKNLDFIAAGTLDLLEYALVRELAMRVATQSGTSTPLLKKLHEAAAQKTPSLETIRQTLEEFQGIGDWLSSPDRPRAEVLNMILETLTDEALGRLVVQAWPERAAQDQYGPEPDAMAAAEQFIEECDGKALQLWRNALNTQLRRRKRVVAAQAAETVFPTLEEARKRINIDALTRAARAAHSTIDIATQVLAGAPHTWTALRAGLSHQTMAYMLRLVPRELRIAILGTLSPRDLSSLRSVLETSTEMAQMKATLGPDIEKMQYDELHKRRRLVEDALASLHMALANGDRAAAAVKLGTLGLAVSDLEEFQKESAIGMPDLLTQSLKEAIAHMRTFLFGNEPDSAVRSALSLLSDTELGQLRTARVRLAPFGFLIDKSDLMAEIKARSLLPLSACAAMDKLFETCADTGATLADIIAELRDAAGILARHNERRCDMGTADSADGNDALAYEAVHGAFERFMQRHTDGPARLRQAMARHPAITGGSLADRLMSLAEASVALPSNETASIYACLPALGMASHVEQHLHAVCMGDAVPEKEHGGPIDTGDADNTGSQDLKIAIAGEFGVEWNEARQLVLPIVTSAHHLRFAQHLSAPLDDDGADLRPVGLRGAGGNVSWFSVSQAFARDVLSQPGISLAMEGVSARGHKVAYPGFDRDLEGDARLAAAADALQALETLAGGDAPALTGLIHHGVVDAFATALSWPLRGSPLKLPNGDRVLSLNTPKDVADFRIRRQPEGNYHIETTLMYTAIDEAFCENSLTSAAEQVSLDPARSRIKATFCRDVDAKGTVIGLKNIVNIRYSLVPEDPA